MTSPLPLYPQLDFELDDTLLMLRQQIQQFA